MVDALARLEEAEIVLLPILVSRSVGMVLGVEGVRGLVE